MPDMRPNRQLAAVLLAPGGVFLAWAGRFLLSSGNSHCAGGITGPGCSGPLAAAGWHYTGVATVAVAAVMVVIALWLVTHTYRLDRLDGG